MHAAIEKELKRLDEIRDSVIARGKEVTDVEAALQAKVPSPEDAHLPPDQVRVHEYCVWGEMFVTNFNQAEPVLRALRKLGYEMLYQQHVVLSSCPCGQLSRVAWRHP